MPKKVLVIDDDAAILTLVKYNLQKEGYQVATHDSGEEALKKIRKEMPDLLVLDIMLPGSDGLEICKELRGTDAFKNLPVLMLTAKTEETDVIVGLELGADDYLPKPFSPKVFLARVKALLRRVEPSAAAEKLVRGPLTIDCEKHKVLLDKDPVNLTATEYHLLKSLAARPGRVFSRDELITLSRSEDTVISDRAIDVHMASLRKKLGGFGDRIETVRGFGYRFREEEEE